MLFRGSGDLAQFFDVHNPCLAPSVCGNFE
jgi:hypothetical protein